MCGSQLIEQVLNYLLPLPKYSKNNYVAIVLKVFRVSHSPEEFQWNFSQIPASDRHEGSLQFYNELLDLLQKHFSPDILMRGAFFNVKNEEFLRALVKDIYIAFISGKYLSRCSWYGLIDCVSAALVLACFLMHSRSVFYTLIITTIMFLSMGIAFFLYTVGCHRFWASNLHSSLCKVLRWSSVSISSLP